MGRRGEARSLYAALAGEKPSLARDFYGLASAVRLGRTPACFAPMQTLSSSAPFLDRKTFLSWRQNCKKNGSCLRAAWLAWIGRWAEADDALRFVCGMGGTRRRGRRKAPCLQDRVLAGAGRGRMRGRGAAGRRVHCRSLGPVIRWLGDSSLARAVGVSSVEPRFLDPIVRRVSQTVDLPASWLLAVVRVESGFEPAALSHAGAIGLMQLMPHTARRIARDLGISEPAVVDLFDPRLNLHLGAWYLARLRQDFRWNLPLALAAYNAGPRRVAQWLAETKADNLDEFFEEIPYRATARYVYRILSLTFGQARRFGENPFFLDSLALPKDLRVPDY